MKPKRSPDSANLATLCAPVYAQIPKHAKPLEALNDRLNTEHIVILGAGPSLNYVEQIIEGFCRSGALFIVPDILARGFIAGYPNSRRIVFTVENRRHLYLNRLKGENIACYINMNFYNLPRTDNQLFLYRFDFDGNCAGEWNEKATQIVSPGTVTGAAIAWVLRTLYNTGALNRAHVHLMGIDLSFPDNQMYGRLAAQPFESNYYGRLETGEYERVLKKTHRVTVKHGFAIRTSEELYKTKLNIEKLLNSADSRLKLYDYSPLGIEHPIAAKWQNNAE